MTSTLNETTFLFHHFCELYHNKLFVSQCRAPFFVRFITIN
ncbi:hypothetical protein HMPREF0208_02683 [Citrobacter koseri]|nr:hypothetical protein HMPREF0208_02683 [Citrobacter koseri]